MIYHLEYTKKALRGIRKLPPHLAKRLLEEAKKLEVDPRPHGCKKLSGKYDYYRIRVGDWRIIYKIQDDQLIILVIDIGPRGSVYQEIQ